MNRLSLYGRALIVGLGLLTTGLVSADPAPFDLIGPMLVGTVTRGDKTLPMAKVPHFAVGDQLVLKAQLPADQSAKYLMVAAFLRGPTNPPPNDWFYRCKTWTRACIKNGVTLKVPQDAQQLLVFFAPKTGGDFNTLRSAVQGRPGAFVRAAQQLNQAALDRARLDRYIAGIRELEDAEPDKLKNAAHVLARSLAIKVDEKCLDRIPALQAPCLAEGHESLILNDGRETSMVTTLTSGPASDLAMQAGSTATLDSGAYLPYIGSVFDIARLLDSFHTAHYQYIPALTSRSNEQMVLLLNTPPSFHKPQSVLVAALPAIEPAQRPTLHPVDAKQSYCAYRSSFSLAVEGAPLVFATDFARETVLDVTGTDGKHVELPAHADAQLGGFVIDTTNLIAMDIDENRVATLSGNWGFDGFSGPFFSLDNPRSHSWHLAPGDESALVVGRENIVHLQSGKASCINDVRMQGADGVETKIDWKVKASNDVELKLPLHAVEPGELVLKVYQYGMADPQRIPVLTFADAGHLDSFRFYAGDADGTLKGSRLDQVENLRFKGYDFKPDALSTIKGSDELSMVAIDPQGVINLKTGDSGKAKVRLNDGRTLSLPVTVGTPRPRGVLIAKDVKPATSDGKVNAIELVTNDELPLDAVLSFSLRTQWPRKFSRDLQIEVAIAEQPDSVMLSVGDGTLTLESATVAVATLHPVSAFGLSAFGALQFRFVSSGVAGDWQHLATLVRLPILTSLECPADIASVCVLRGGNLFLLESVAADAQFSSPLEIPEGFPGFSVVVPHPVDGHLYIKLRDSSVVAHRVTLAITPSVAATPSP